MIEPDSNAVPNAARIYDFMLGGHHHFDADRRAAEVLTQLVPSTPRWVRMLRSFLHETVAQLADEGFDRFLDLASGLPTAEHIDGTVPHARVVYVDNDPLVVAYGTEILGGKPGVQYLQADIRNIASILGSAAVRELLEGASRLAIGFNAVTCFLTEEEISRIARTLYDWAPHGSKLFATFETKAPHLMTPRIQALVDMFEQMGSPYRFLTLQRSQELMDPWQPDTRGFRPLAELLGLPGEVPEEDREGVELEFYGATLVK
jgi:SAM-dependent methyltransferase